MQSKRTRLQPRTAAGRLKVAMPAAAIQTANPRIWRGEHETPPVCEGGRMGTRKPEALAPKALHFTRLQIGVAAEVSHNSAGRGIAA